MALTDHVVLAADFSEPSKIALQATLALVSVTDAKRVTIIYAAKEVVLPEEDGPEVLREQLARLRRNIEAGARRSMEELLASLPPARCPVDVVVVHGKPARVIPSKAKELGATLLVLGTHARKGLRRMVMGSIAETVLRGAELPTLVAHTGEDGRGPDVELAALTRVLIAVDVASGAHDVVRVGLEAASALRNVRPAVTLLAVTDLPALVAEEAAEHPEGALDRQALAERAGEVVRAKIDAIATAAATAGLEPEPMVAEGDAAEEILRAAAALDARLIVVGTHGRGRASFFELGSTAAEVVRHADVSVLVVPTAQSQRPAPATP